MRHQLRLFCFDFARLGSAEELNSMNFHRLENILTLDAVLHRHFDSLTIWLEKTDYVSHEYLSLHV